MSGAELKEFDINQFEIGQNLFIDASAGTGKTYTIQQLTAKMVKAGIPLSQILIVTYTEKATGELRDRIRQKMEECLEEEPLNSYREALLDIHKAPIFTIHSFCKTILSEFAYEANASMDMEVVEDNQIRTIVEGLIRDEWSKDSVFLRLLSGADFALEKIIDFAVNMVMLYSSSDDVHLFKTNLDCHNFQDLCGEFKGFQEHFQRLSTISNTKIINNANFKKFLSKVEAWNDSTPFLDKFGATAKSDVINALKEESMYDYIESVEFIWALKGNPTSSILQTEMELFLMGKLQPIHEAWQAYKKSNKLQSYNDMIKTVRDEVFVNNNESLIQKVRQTYKYAIIDEFQDTNQRQWDIFKKLFLESPQIGGKWQNAIIVVGDPKQSIYSFQGADIKVYRKAIEEIGIENGRRLSTNNRSSNILIHGCNLLFRDYFFKDKSDFTPSNCPPESQCVWPAVFVTTDIIPPIWISPMLDGENYCKYAVLKILECFNQNNSDVYVSALRIYDKRLKAMRPVKFSDFAILGRTRSELAVMENLLQRVGIPYSTYKDTNLFNGAEASHWLALLKAIDVVDFSSINRKVLNAALVSSFFRIPILEVERSEYEDPTISPMKEILKWRMLASKGYWAELQECIYSDTEIDKYLNSPRYLQSLTKIRQIGSYIFTYLYNHKTTLEEAIKHLEGLSNSTEESDEMDSNIVAIGSDFDTVKLMTCHASKGLAFPIVISLCGMKGYNNQVPGPFLYRIGDEKYLSFSKDARRRKKEEDLEEFRRLAYVALTRAESLLILPNYEKPTREDSFAFLRESLCKLEMANDQFEDYDRLHYCSEANEVKEKESWYVVREKTGSGRNNLAKHLLDGFSTEMWDESRLRVRVREILNMTQKTFLSPEQGIANIKISELQKNLGNLVTYQYSYSSLAEKKRVLEGLQVASEYEHAIPLEGRFNKDESFENNNDEGSLSFIRIDDSESIVQPCNEYNSLVIIDNIHNYPKGSKLGTAIHEVFEKCNFQNVELNLSELISKAFIAQSLPILEHRDWANLTATFVKNTLNASLPEIRGGKGTGKAFSLNELPAKNRKAEMEFHLEAKNKEWLNSYSKGFMDLLFLRKDEEGNDLYSILDWKSDIMEDSQYSSKEALYEKVTREYSVQRVLYSYCLIIWLKQFYKDLTETEIFEKHFGGVYYIFVRGTSEGTNNGVYAQTWSSFKALESSYKNILKLMRL